MRAGLYTRPHYKRAPQSVGNIRYWTDDLLASPAVSEWGQSLGRELGSARSGSGTDKQSNKKNNLKRN